MAKKNYYFEKVIIDRKLIKQIIGREAMVLFLQYNTKSKRAFFQTERMPKRKAICIERVNRF